MSKENSLKKVNFLAMHDYFQIKNDWLKREHVFKPQNLRNLWKEIGTSLNEFDSTKLIHSKINFTVKNIHIISILDSW